MNTILITGANRGIGLEFTCQYARDEWQVLACCRAPERAQALQVLASNYTNIDILSLDVTDTDQIRTLSQRLQGKPLDILLNNAGVIGEREGNRLGSFSKSAWLQVFAANSVAPALLAEALVDSVAISERKVIATVSSKMGSIEDNGSGGMYMYRTSKTAVNQVMKCLSIDLAQRGICALTLHPGWVQTDMGGPNALIGVEESVAGMKKLLDNASLKQSGLFVGYDGEVIPW